MSAVKQIADAYVAGMEQGKARADARSAAQVINVVGQGVESLPDASVERLPDGLLPILEGVGALRNGGQRLSELGVDEADRVAGDSHETSPSGSDLAAATAESLQGSVGETADGATPSSGAPSVPMEPCS